MTSSTLSLAPQLPKFHEAAKMINCLHETNGHIFGCGKPQPCLVAPPFQYDNWPSLKIICTQMPLLTCTPHMHMPSCTIPRHTFTDTHQLPSDNYTHIHLTYSIPHILSHSNQFVVAVFLLHAALRLVTLPLWTSTQQPLGNTHTSTHLHLHTCTHPQPHP